MLQQTIVFIMRAYPKPDNRVSIQDTQRTMPSADAYRINWLLFAYPLELKAVRLRIELPQFVDPICPALHV